MTKLAELQKFIEVEKQPSPGLVQRRVTVHPEGGQPFTRRQWVRPDEIEGENKRLNEDFEEPENFNRIPIREYIALIRQYTSDELEKEIDDRVIRIDRYQKKLNSFRQELDKSQTALRLLNRDNIKDESVIKKLRKNIDKAMIEIDGLSKEIKYEDFKGFILKKEIIKRDREGNLNDYEGISAEDLDDSQRLISNSKVTQSSNLGGGINVTEIIELENGKKAVFKPLRGEVAGVGSTIKGPLYLKEVAAYKVSKMLGFDYVPPTTVKYIGNDIGSAQEFVENAKHLRLGNLHPDIIKDCALFDQVIGNVDRHGGNALQKNDTPVLIDHGFSFPDDPTVMPYSIFMKEIDHPDDSGLSDRHNDLLTNFYKNKKEHAQKLRPYLRKREIAGMFVRVNDMLENRSYFLTRKENE